jgi:hypothetical protein
MGSVNWPSGIGGLPSLYLDTVFVDVDPSTQWAEMNSMLSFNESTGKWIDQKLYIKYIFSTPGQASSDKDLLLHRGNEWTDADSKLKIPMLQDCTITATRLENGVNVDMHNEFQMLSRTGNTPWTNIAMDRPITKITTSHTVSRNHVGHFIRSIAIQPINITIPVDTLLPGEDVVYFLDVVHAIQFVGVSPTVIIKSKNSYRRLSIVYSTCILKCIDANVFILMGELGP